MRDKDLQQFTLLKMLSSQHKEAWSLASGVYRYQLFSTRWLSLVCVVKWCYKLEALPPAAARSAVFILFPRVSARCRSGRPVIYRATALIEMMPLPRTDYGHQSRVDWGSNVACHAPLALLYHFGPFCLGLRPFCSAGGRPLHWYGAARASILTMILASVTAHVLQSAVKLLNSSWWGVIRNSKACQTHTCISMGVSNITC